MIYGERAYKFSLILKEYFSQLDAPCHFEIEKAIISLRQDQLRVTSYYTKPKVLCNELTNLQVFPICSL